MITDESRVAGVRITDERTVRVADERSVAGVLAEIKEELKEFAQTRLSLLRSEMKDKVSMFKTAMPLIAFGLVFLWTGWLALTGALIVIIAEAFYPNRFAYFFSFIIVGAGYLLIGGIAASFAVRGLREHGVVPERTIRVLKQDQLWLQTEARQQL